MIKFFPGYSWSLWKKDVENGIFTSVWKQQFRLDLPSKCTYPQRLCSVCPVFTYRSKQYQCQPRWCILCPIQLLSHWFSLKGSRLEIAVTGTARPLQLAIKPGTFLDFGPCTVGKIMTKKLLVGIKIFVLLKMSGIVYLSQKLLLLYIFLWKVY